MVTKCIEKKGIRFELFPKEHMFICAKNELIWQQFDFKFV